MKASLEIKLEHIGLAARNPAALQEWYVNTLEAELIFEMPQQPPAFLLRLGGMVLEIYPARSESDLTRDNGLAGWRHVALQVSSIEKAREILAARGIHFTEPVKPAGGGGRVLFFSDPEGNLLHLVERLPGGYQ